MFVVLTFYLLLLKYPYFEIDANLRMKIFWEGHPTKCKETYKHAWLWMNGMDSKFIRRELLNLTNRKNEARERLEKYFKLNEDDKMYHKRKMSNNKLNIIQNINKNQPEIRKGIENLINNKINM